MCKAIIKSGFCPRRRLACSFVHSIKKIFSILSKNPKYKIVLCLPTESKNSSSIITSCNEKDLETHKKKQSASYLFRILTIITKNQRIVWHEFPLPLTISFFIWKYEKVWKHPGRKIIKVSLIDIVKNIRGYQLNTHWLFFQNMTLTSNMATKKKTYFQPSQLQSQTISIHMKIWKRFTSKKPLQPITTVQNLEPRDQRCTFCPMPISILISLCQLIHQVQQHQVVAWASLDQIN